MITLLIVNVVVVVSLGLLGFFLGPDDLGNASRGVFGFWLFWVFTVLSFWAWVIYAAVHFISKYW